MKKPLFLSIVLLVFIINYSWGQSFEESDSIIKWFEAGTNLSEYHMGGDPFSIENDQVGFVKFTGKDPNGFGTWMTNIEPDKYRGNRVKLSAKLKCYEIENWAGMWMRVDGENRKILSFDNMGNRPLKGSKNWELYEIVLDVPAGSTNISFGILLGGKGQISVKELELLIVDVSVEVTNIMSP